MKVIGKTGDGWGAAFIVTASDDELAKVCGFDYSGSKGAPRIEIGKEIRVSEIYGYLREVSSADAEIKKAAMILKNAADLATMVVPMFPPVKEGEKEGVQES